MMFILTKYFGKLVECLNSDYFGTQNVFMICHYPTTQIFLECTGLSQTYLI